MLALALAGAGDADAAMTHAKLGAALAARELRRVRTVLRKAGADAALSELTEHLRDLAAGAEPAR